MISKDAIRYDEAAAYEQMIGRHQQCATNRLMPSFNGGLNGWAQHFILDEKMECRDESRAYPRF